MGSYSFTITHKFPSLNQVIAAAKKHWAVYSKMKRELTDLVAGYASSTSLAMGSCLPLDHVWINLTFYEKSKGRFRDWDNVTFAKKFILDGLVQAGIIEDDSPLHIMGIEEKVVFWDDYGVKIEIVYRD